MILFISCTHVVPNAGICQNTAVDTLVARAIPKLNFDWLPGSRARFGPFASQGLRKRQPVRAGRPLVAKASSSVAQIRLKIGQKHIRYAGATFKIRKKQHKVAADSCNAALERT